GQPDNLFTGRDSFKYVVRDQDGDSEPAEVTILVGVPVAQKRSYTVARDTVTSFDQADGVLKGDRTDDEGDPVTVLLNPPPAEHPEDRSAFPQHGTLELHSDGLFTYHPDAGFRGEDSFQYIVRDVDGDSAPAKVTITVGKAPDVEDHEYQTPVNTALS